MPSDLQRVATSLVECIDQIPSLVDALHRMAAKYRQEAGMIVDFGSANPAARVAALQLDAAAQACDRAAHLAGMVPSKARAWAEAMVSGARTADSPQPAGRDPTGGAGGDGGGGGDSLDERRLGLLPKWERGEKTRGYRLGDPQGTPRLVSGHDEYQEKARDFIRDRQLGPKPHSLTIESHVEVKFAMKMRERGLVNETIVINKVPCDLPYGCQAFLKDILPPGAKLTVIAPGFKRTFEGQGEDQR